MIRKGDEGWLRLFSVWENERRPGSVVVGGKHYMVFTPDGNERPVFSPVDDTVLYSGTSTGMAQANPVRVAPKHSDAGGSGG